MTRTNKRVIAVMLTGTLTWASATSARAALAPATLATETSQTVAVQRSQDLQTIQTFLERKEVAGRLGKMGFSQKEVASRLGNLTDTELHRVASRIDKENPGADGADALVTLLVIGILVLLFFYLLKRV